MSGEVTRRCHVPADSYLRPVAQAGPSVLAQSFAVAAQLKVERRLQEMGERALAEAVRRGEPAVLLVGRSYNAFTHAMLSSEMGPKPYLTLEIDAHTADAGVQTRLEAFLDPDQA
jgi:predicted nucleotide-binding protein (sugar kinase/HSP70/actin superfamily)